MILSFVAFIFTTVVAEKKECTFLKFIGEGCGV